ncbi:MAG: M28 family peptidase [Chloroflexi bacterium]|nr:M28 family peptidase [Chloroflexota bacterium]
MDLASLLGADEPGYADPDFPLRDAADEWLARIDAGRLRRLVESLPAPRSRLHAPEAMSRTDELIVDAWRRDGWRVGRQHLHLRDARGILDYPDPGRGGGGLAFHTYEELEGTNLVAIAEGATDEAVVIVAHHDTVRGSPGADDNGAGVAVLLELAERFAGRRFRRTVILAAPDFEEIGIIGSRNLARWLRRNHRVRAAVVFDPIGYMNPSPGSQAVPAGLDRIYPRQLARLEAGGNAGDTVVAVYRRRSVTLAREWATCLAATIGRERVLLLRDPVDLPVIGPLLFALPAARNFSRSDHVRFWQARLPAIQVTNTANFRNPNYHRPTDTADTLDYDTLARVAAATALLIERLADAEV